MITLSTELSRIHGLGAQFLEKLHKLHITTVEELLWHFPSRYEDFSKVVPIGDLAVGMSATVAGIVRKVEARRTWRRSMTVVEVLIRDETGVIKAIWFNQPYIQRILRPGVAIHIAGKVSVRDDELYFSNPTFELTRGEPLRHTAGLIPIYPETKGLTSKGLRYLVKPILQVLPPLEDFIPAPLRSAEHIPDLTAALRSIHFPETLQDALNAKRRFAFQELFLLQVHNAKTRHALAQSHATSLLVHDNDLETIMRTLPFALTPAQMRCLHEIVNDLKAHRPMNRLLQGDVGSGKTVIALIAALLTAREGHQVAFMAPTEVLARQHYLTIEKLVAPLLKEWGIEIGLLLSAVKDRAKRQLIAAIQAGMLHIMVGTHALIEKKVVFHDLALVVIDEQHRFGVSQRAELVGRRPVKAEHASAPLPHLLSMSATPIPRTLSLTLFGDLDLSIVDELPKGRKAIVTKIIAPHDRGKAYAFVRGEVRKGRQVFIICPRIQKSDVGDQNSDDTEPGIQNPISGIHNLKSGWDDVKAVKEEYERLRTVVFPDLTLQMLHGKLKSKEKEEIMRSFSCGAIQILVSTSVVEVGVDVPNASIMIIEGADRFGLSQLYQFRGRIGRGEHQSYCFLFTDSESGEVQARLHALLTAKNGFELAEKDLEMRGPGEFLGDKQTGIPDIAMQGMADIELIKTTRDAAQKLVARDPELIQHPALKRELEVFRKNIHLE